MAQVTCGRSGDKYVYVAFDTAASKNTEHTASTHMDVTTTAGSATDLLDWQEHQRYT